ncbi:MAG TPA: CARDB domain-containing protein [Gemmatimonadota bacterium]|nr:CARDB domain-containing protein [Gemmatimonadota bacterium]
MIGSISHRRSAVTAASAALLAGLIWIGCSQDATGPATDPALVLQGLRPAINVQERHTDRLLEIPGVIGTAVGYTEEGRAAVRLFTTEPGIEGLPTELDGFPVEVKVTGLIVAYTDPTKEQPRPVPTGVSTGHPAVTAGTIGARVRDVYGNVYALSNNHVFANQNDADFGDPALQPGAFDGGTDPEHRIGTLDSFMYLDFQGGDNVMDAAIVTTTVELLGNSTPADDGYGTPSSTTAAAYIGQPVQKYGRTTGLTQGSVSDLNVTVNVCYEVIFIFCMKQAKFVNQIGITPGTFSGGGDSGSLIVTADANLNPVGLLFAGGETHTFANPIGPVLSFFGVTIDDSGGEPPPPPPDVTDIAITEVNAPASAIVGDEVSIDVVVTNVGNQDVTDAFTVTLTNDGTEIGSETVAGLVHGTSTTKAFTWYTTGETIGNHVLTATHDFTDDDMLNNSMSTTVTIEELPPPVSEMHVGDIDVYNAYWSGRTWNALVTIRVHDDAHQAVAGVLVQGTWRVGRSDYSSSCTTTPAGSCTVPRGNINRRYRSVTFTVDNLTDGTLVYNSSENHDDEGDSNGTTITVSRPD